MAEPKKCPDCETEMKLQKQRDLGNVVWVCPNCRRSINAQPEKDSN